MAMPMALPRYTVDDLREFPEDGNRYELLDGFLLVTPAPNYAHQVVATELAASLVQYVGTSGQARVAAIGEIERAPDTLLQPDILVVPASYPITMHWRKLAGWWLAVEVLSRSSRVYDQQFKRNAYLALGVREVWLVDLDARCVLASRREGPIDQRIRDTLRWHPPEQPEPLELDLARLFRGLE